VSWFAADGNQAPARASKLVGSRFRALSEIPFELRFVSPHGAQRPRLGPARRSAAFGIKLHGAVPVLAKPIFLLFPSPQIRARQPHPVIWVVPSNLQDFQIFFFLLPPGARTSSERAAPATPRTSMSCGARASSRSTILICRNPSPSTSANLRTLRLPRRWLVLSQSREN